MLLRFFGWILMAVFLFVALAAGGFGLLLYWEQDRFAWFFFGFAGLFCLAPLYMVVDTLVTLVRMAVRRDEEDEEEGQEDEEETDEAKEDRWEFDLD